MLSESGRFTRSAFDVEADTSPFPPADGSERPVKRDHVMIGGTNHQQKGVCLSLARGSLSECRPQPRQEKRPAAVVYQNVNRKDVQKSVRHLLKFKTQLQPQRSAESTTDPLGASFNYCVYCV